MPCSKILLSLLQQAPDLLLPALPAFSAALPRALREALVAWDYSADIDLPSFREIARLDGNGAAFSKTYELGGAHKFIADHDIDGRIIVPAVTCAARQGSMTLPT